MTTKALAVVSGGAMDDRMAVTAQALTASLRLPAPWLAKERLGGGHLPPEPTGMVVDIYRQSLNILVDWQEEAVRLWRAHRELSPAFVDDMTAAGLMRRCVVLSSDETGALVFRRIGEPTLRYFGRSWAEDRLGRPHVDDPYSAFAQRIDAEYREAIDGGDPVHNRLVVHGTNTPFIYSHLLLGYALSSGRKAVFALVDY